MRVCKGIRRENSLGRLFKSMMRRVLLVFRILLVLLEVEIAYRTALVIPAIYQRFIVGNEHLGLEKIIDFFTPITAYLAGGVIYAICVRQDEFAFSILFLIVANGLCFFGLSLLGFLFYEFIFRKTLSSRKVDVFVYWVLLMIPSTIATFPAVGFLGHCLLNAIGALLIVLTTSTFNKVLVAIARHRRRRIR